MQMFPTRKVTSHTTTASIHSRHTLRRHLNSRSPAAAVAAVSIVRLCCEDLSHEVDADEAAVGELDDPCQQNVEQVCVEDLQLARRRLTVVVVETSQHARQGLRHFRRFKLGTSQTDR